MTKSLAKLVAVRLRRVRGPRRRPYEPSLATLLYILSVALPVAAIAHLPHISVYVGGLALRLQLPPLEAPLAEVYAGLCTFVFALLIFVAETMRDGKSDLKRTVLKITLVWPLSVLLVVGIASIAFGKVNWLALLLLVPVAAGTVVALYRLLRVLLFERVRIRETQAMLADRVRASVLDAARLRLCRNVLVGWLRDRKLELTYGPWVPDGWPRQGLVVAASDGTVHDIDLAKLQKVAARVQALRSPGPGEPSPHTRAALSMESSLSHAGYIVKALDNDVRRGDALLAFSGLEGVSACQSDPILQEAQAAFDIRRSGRAEGKGLPFELKDLRERMVSAIRDRRPDLVAVERDTYESLADAFLKALSDLDVHYSAQEAESERGSIGGGWSEVKWLRDEVHFFLNEAIRTQDTEVCGEVLRLPLHIAWKAVEYGDHYVFKEFIWFEMLPYYGDESLPVPVEPRVAERLRKEAAGMLRFTRYVIAPRRQRGDRPLPEDSGEYFSSILRALSDAAKNALSRRAYAVLAELVRLVRDLRHDFTNEAPIMKEVENRTWEVLYGLAAYGLDALLARTDDSELRETLGSLLEALPTSHAALVQLFLRCLSEEAEHRWGWSWWEMQPSDVGAELKFGVIKVDEKMKRLFVYAALRLAASQSGRAIQLHYTPELAGAAEHEGGLIAMLDNIRTGRSDMAAILVQPEVDAVEPVNDALRSVADEHKRREHSRIKVAPLSDARRTQFQSDLLEGYLASSTLREMFALYGLLRAASGDEPKPAHIRYRSVFPKEFFIDDPSTSRLSMGDHYGRGLARGETQAMTRRLVELCARPTEQTYADVISRMPSLDTALVVVGTDWHLFLASQRDFEAEYPTQQSPPARAGRAGRIVVGGKTVPVHALICEATEDQALVLDKTRLGEMLVDVGATEQRMDRHNMTPRVRVDVQDLFREDAERTTILDEKPDWLVKMGDRNTQEEHLRGQVLLDVELRFWFQPHPDFIGYVIPSPPPVEG